MTLFDHFSTLCITETLKSEKVVANGEFRIEKVLFLHKLVSNSQTVIYYKQDNDNSLQYHL